MLMLQIILIFTYTIIHKVTVFVGHLSSAKTLYPILHGLKDL